MFNEELARQRVPAPANVLGLVMGGPVVIARGNEEQKERYLEPILSGEEIWCQGFSEPGAGSDLAGLSTRAEDRGDHFIVNGQKVWTSGAQFADWIYLLVRTDPTAARHRGISYLLVDMKTPGITVRPIVMLDGAHHVNDVFLDNVKVPVANRIGKEGEGWT